MFLHRQHAGHALEGGDPRRDARAHVTGKFEMQILLQALVRQNDHVPGEIALCCTQQLIRQCADEAGVGRDKVNRYSHTHT